MSPIRRQLSLFIPSEQAIPIEAFRHTYNPAQHQLIPVHVTLCREDELIDWPIIASNLRHHPFSPIVLEFRSPRRFSGGKGLSMEPANTYETFTQLRKRVLRGAISQPRDHVPHITLIHPRNGICTDEIWMEIQDIQLPTTFSFPSISLIEQINGGKWKVLEVFDSRLGLA